MAYGLHAVIFCTVCYFNQVLLFLLTQYQRTCEQSWSGIVTAKVRWFRWSSVQKQSPALNTRLRKWWFTIWSCIFPRIHHWGKEDYAYV